MTEYCKLLALSPPELAKVDPLVMNLLVGQSIPSLAGLEISRYERLADEWADGIRHQLPQAERMFRRSPHEWKNDIHFFRLGVLCGFLENEVGIAYNEDQRSGGPIQYTNPCDLFLNGVMDTRRGTCGNMAALHVAIGWRLGWPVSLACVNSHFICRYDDGRVTHNIESTQSGYGGFKSDPDDYLIKHYNLPAVAIACGSDWKALTPLEMLGAFVGLRARHTRDLGLFDEAELDYLLARRLYPNSRLLYKEQMNLSVARSVKMFEAGENGSPETLALMIQEQLGMSMMAQQQNGQVQTVASSGIRGVIHTPIY